MEFKTFEELDKHLKEKHSIHYTSQRTQEYLRALKMEEEVKSKPKKVVEKIKKNVKPKSKKKKKR